jgi:hypothetical protein
MPILRDYAPKKVWTAYFTDPNNVWYIVNGRNGITLKTLDQMHDYKEVYVDTTKRNVMRYAKYVMTRYFNIPKTVTSVEVVQCHPVLEDGKLWFDSIQYKQYTLSEFLKWH